MTPTTDMLSPPGEVLAEFFPTEIEQATLLDGGKVNTTFRVTDSLGELSILQRLGPPINPAMSEDYAVVADHLKREGWEVAIPLRTRQQELIVVDENDNNWRGYSYLESDNYPIPSSNTTLLAFAKMIGSLSFSLSGLDYTPKHSIPDFHDADHIAKQLISQLPVMPDEDKQFSDTLLDRLSEEPPIESGDAVIHGDPKLTNALFRGGEPFTLIDWDTLMRGNPMLDLADMLRSITGKLRETSTNNVNANSLKPLIKAYQETADIPLSDRNEHLEEAITATRSMCLMLAMRYMSDTVNNSYFDWEPSLYPDAAAHNRACAHRQWENFQSIRG